MKYLAITILVFGGLIALTALHFAAKTTTPAHVIACADTSGRSPLRGFRPRLGASTLLVARLLTDLNPDDHLTALRMDASVETWFDGPPPASSDTFFQMAAAALGRFGSRDGTYPAKLWGRIATEVAASQEP